MGTDRTPLCDSPQHGWTVEKALSREEMIPLAPLARRYLAVLRWNGIAYIAMFVVLPMLIAICIYFPVSGCVFAVVMLAFLVAAAILVLTSFYLGDFTCPQCGLDSSFRRHGKGRALSWCFNCGLSLKEVAASDLGYNPTSNPTDSKH